MAFLKINNLSEEKKTFTEHKYSVTFVTKSEQKEKIYDKQGCSYQGESLNIPTAF